MKTSRIKKKNNIIYCWLCDHSKKTGEGNLARLYIKKEFRNKKTKIISVNNLINKKNLLYKIINYKYISPIIGIIYCWSRYLSKKKVVYVNYLPFWNFLIFLILPPKTILGPITGGARYNIKGQFLIRSIIFPIFYKLSEVLLNYRKGIFYFSTDLLKKYLSKKTLKKCQFNYIFFYFNKRKKIKKNIDFLIYYKIHKNKKNFFRSDLLNKLIKLKLKIHIVGNKFANNSVINHGFVDNKKINFLLSKTRFTISSDENFLNLFTIEAINNHVKIITDKNNLKQIKHFKKYFVFLDYKKSENFLKKIIKSSI